MKPKADSKKRLIKTKNLGPGNAQQGNKGGKNSNVTAEVGPGTQTRYTVDEALQVPGVNTGLFYSTEETLIHMKK